ncbi:MAG TPA: response regulator [Gemmatimonadales bacterium]|jgi:signal transduction histidine kinase/CheY-like chemotaxis protein|nr:response regulator [Gemmatimonadales bacterium]
MPNLRSRFRSLELRLPLALCGLLLTALVVLTYVAYLNVHGAVLDAANERLRNISSQFAELLGQQAQGTAASAESLASRPALIRQLSGFTVADSEIDAALWPAGPDSARLASVELWDARGRRVVATGRDTALVSLVSNEGFLTSVASPEHGSVGPFMMVGDSLAVPSLAPVRQGSTLLGHVVRWHYLSNSAASRKATLDLIGPGASILIGSPKTGVWTDLGGRVPAPPVSAWADTGIVAYQHADLGARMAAGRAVPGVPWVVQIELSRTAVLRPARDFLGRFSIIALGVLALGLTAVWLLVRRITVPLRDLTVASRAFSRGDYASRVQVRGHEELTRLGEAFNHMAERVQDTHASLEAKVDELKSTREQFAQGQRMEAVGQLAGGIAHDFNNLLTVILGEAELSLGGEAADYPDAMRQIKKAGERAADLTRQLLAFSRRQLIEPTVFNVNELVQDLTKMIGRLIGEHITLVTRAEAPHSIVRADRGQIEQIILNLVVNARDAMPGGGRLAIATQTLVLDQEFASARPELRAGEFVMISVTDTGSGMSDEVKTRIFEPFFTTKERGRGTGLGLATSYGIAKQAGGHLAAYTELGVGTTMRLYLPVAEPSVRPAPAAKEGSDHGNETILLVEDDPGVRKIAARILAARGYRVLEAETGDAALAVLAQHAGTVHLLLTDVVLPGMSGREVAARVRALRPGIKVLFASGYTDDVILQHLLEAGDEVILQKPFAEADLSRKVRAVLDHPPER